MAFVGRYRAHDNRIFNWLKDHVDWIVPVLCLIAALAILLLWPPIWWPF